MTSPRMHIPPRSITRYAAAIFVAISAPLAHQLYAQTPAAQTTPAQTTSARTITKSTGVRLGRFSLIGAASGSALALGYYFVSAKGQYAGGCRPFSCALPFLTLSGALSGLFIGSELNAQRRAETPRAGANFAFTIAEASILAAPNAFDIRDSLVAVVSDSGAQLLSATATPKALRRRAAGLSNLRQVAIVPRSGALVLGTATALWEASLISGPASRIGDGPVDALASSDDAVLSASGKRLQLRRGTGASVRIDTLAMSTTVTALTYDASTRAWWIGTDSTLMNVTSNDAGLRVGLTLHLPAAARSIAVSADWVAVALGDQGIVAWQRATLAALIPTPVRLVHEPRFAYDLAFLDGTLFVAGGVDGLYRVSLSPTPQVLGSSRQFPFATTVRAEGGAIWVGDRIRKAVIRVTP